ncbi:hypothetical protein ACP70R_014983 [Stipagrostis hirtigluma subsp. patula]
MSTAQPSCPRRRKPPSPGHARLAAMAATPAEPSSRVRAGVDGEPLPAADACPRWPGLGQGHGAEESALGRRTGCTASGTEPGARMVAGATSGGGDMDEGRRWMKPDEG